MSHRGDGQYFMTVLYSPDLRRRSFTTESADKEGLKPTGCCRSGYTFGVS